MGQRRLREERVHEVGGADRLQIVADAGASEDLRDRFCAEPTHRRNTGEPLGGDELVVNVPRAVAIGDGQDVVAEGLEAVAEAPWVHQNEAAHELRDSERDEDRRPPARAVATQVDRADVEAVEKLDERVDVLAGVEAAPERLAETEEVKEVRHDDASFAPEELREPEEGEAEDAEAVEEDDGGLGGARGGVVVVEAAVARAEIAGAEAHEAHREGEGALHGALTGEACRGSGGTDHGHSTLRYDRNAVRRKMGYGVRG